MQRRKKKARRPVRAHSRRKKRVQRARHAAARHKHRAKGSNHTQKVIDPQLARLLKVYEEAMRQFNKQNYRQAKDLFEKTMAGHSRELAERSRVHLAICDQRLERPPAPRLRGAEEHYHYAISQINLGNYDEARTHLEKARKLSPKADYVHYALASVFALIGETDDALEHLGTAIKLRPENRYHARNDDDFKPIAESLRFQELVQATN